MLYGKPSRRDTEAERFMEDKRDMGIAERIDKSIKASGKSFADVAKVMGVTPTTVWNWARGNTAISVESAARLAETLGVVPSWLTFGEGKPADSRTHVSVRGDAVKLVERRHDRESKALVEGSEWILPRAFFSRAAGADASPDTDLRRAARPPFFLRPFFAPHIVSNTTIRTILGASNAA